MFVRLALEDDFDAIIAMGKANLAETMAGEPHDEFIMRETLYRYLDTANPTFYVVEHRREVIAFLQMNVSGYDYRAGFYTIQKVLYVSPEKRGTRASVILMKHLIAESQRLGAVEIVGGNDNGFQSDRTAAFLEHFGFRKTGHAMSKRLE